MSKRDCETCTHRVKKDGQAGCELWDCEYVPTGPERDTVDTVVLALLVENLTKDEREMRFGGICDTVEIFKTYTKSHIREMFQ